MTETNTLLKIWEDGIRGGDIVPVLGAGSHAGSMDVQNGDPMPAHNDDLIIALNGGKTMSPKLMSEFSRAAMNIEFKRGRKYVERFLTNLYENRIWSASSQMTWISDADPRYVIDINRDSVILDLMSDRPHVLIQGVARLSKADPRYRAYHFDPNDGYVPINEVTDSDALAAGAMPIIFKPLGCARPMGSFIASDADYVDFITEMMGGFALPPFLKQYRKSKKYLIAGVRLKKDTERMVLRDIIYDADPESSGWLIADNPTRKEINFCKQQNLEIIDIPMSDLW